MKAAVYRQYGPPEVVAVAEVATPQPAPNELLVRIHSASVTSGDARLRAFNIPIAFWLFGRLAFGLFRPRRSVLGSDFAGEVVAVGNLVTRYRVGDRVFGMSLMQSHAEYRVIAESGAVAPIPENVSYEEAAAVPFGGTTALHFLGIAGLRSGQKVLVIGASGAVGVAFVQVARNLGAEVTGVSSRANVELVRSLGASDVIDYTAEEIFSPDRRYDIIVDTVGSTRFADAKGSLAATGVYIPVVSSPADMFLSMTGRTGKQRIITGTAAETPEAIRLLAEWLARGELRAVIDSRFPLAEVAAAHRRVDSGRKRGSVLLDMTAGAVQHS